MSRGLQLEGVQVLADEASLLNVTGVIGLTSFKGSRLEGALEAPSVLVIPNDHVTKPLDGAALINVAIPLSYTGIATLGYARECATFKPASVKGLAEHVHESIAPAYVRILSELAADKGASGLAVAQLTWWRYHLARRGANGVERVLLSAYSLVGYGERFGRAFEAWLVCILLTAPVWRGGYDELLGKQRCDNKTVPSWPHALFDAFLAPATTLRLADKSASSINCVNSEWVTLSTVALTVSLGIALFSARKLIKR